LTFDTPILFLICNRPKQTRITFERIRRLKPTRLFISQDGTHKETRDIIKVDWECNYLVQQSPKKSGCKNGELFGLNWFFDNVESGIILEDDTVPDMSFFRYCDLLLDRYKHDKRVWQIAGSNHQNKTVGNGSYFFSQNIHCWGWATWADRWKQYTENIDYDLIPKNQKWLIKYLKNIDKYDTWDYQWVYTILSNNGVSVYPNVNMIENIGFDGSGQHMKYGSHKPAYNIGRIIEPMEIQYKADKQEIRNNKFKKYRDLIHNYIA